MRTFVLYILMTVTLFCLTGCGRSVRENLAADLFGSDRFRIGMVERADDELFGALPQEATVVIVEDATPGSLIAYELSRREERRQFLLDRTDERNWENKASTWIANKIQFREGQTLDSYLASHAERIDLVISLETIADSGISNK